MRKHIQLNIPEACHESWDQMTTFDKARPDGPVGRGRFCSSCQKQVIDFTSMRDEQLAVFFKKKSTGSVCGRFMQDQLDRAIDIPKKRIPWVKYFFQIALPAFLISSKAHTQGKLRIPTGDTVVVTGSKKDKAEKATIAEIEKRISGTVVDDNGEGIPYASLYIKGTTIGVAADNTGSFSLKFIGNENSFVLISSCVGYQNVESMVRFTFSKTVENIIISLTPVNTLGEVVVVGFTERKGRFVMGAMGVVKKANIPEIICNKISQKTPTLKLYPNPVKRSTSLIIEMNKQETGTYLLQLSTLNGQVLLSKEIWVDENSRVIKLDIPSIASGTYFISLKDKQSGKTNTEKIIVE